MSDHTHRFDKDWRIFLARHLRREHGWSIRRIGKFFDKGDNWAKLAIEYEEER